MHWVSVGARSNIQDLSCLHGTNARFPVLVEEEVSVAHHVMLHGCTVRRGALIGMSSILMDGAEIGEGCLVAAGSLVTEGFKAPPHVLVAGSPAIVKRELSKEQRELIAGIWMRYVRYKEAYFRDGWTAASTPAVAEPQPGFTEGHPWP